jgi:hypothetical protein
LNWRGEGSTTAERIVLTTKDTKSTKVKKINFRFFAFFVIFVVSEITAILPGYRYKTLQSAELGRAVY